MIDENEIMPFNFFKYGGVYTGECGTNKQMRYRIARIGEKPDFKFEVSVWQGPFAYCAVLKEDVTAAEFEFSNEGRLEAISWLQSVYDNDRDRWDSAPDILAAPIDLDEMYKNEEDAGAKGANT